MTSGDDPSILPSTMVDRPVPEFDLPPLPWPRERGVRPRRPWSAAGPKLVNVFASWCVPCLAEHPLITRLSEEGVPVYGINYKDEPPDALAWLERHGDPPYAAIGSDPEGDAGIDWGTDRRAARPIGRCRGPRALPLSRPADAGDRRASACARCWRTWPDDPPPDAWSIALCRRCRPAAGRGAPPLALEPEERLEDPLLEQARAEELSKGLRCVVCQNQSIDDSNAELAQDLRRVVRERLVVGDTQPTK